MQLNTQDQVARECHVAPAYLCRLFRRYDHQTCYQYLMRLKLNEATELLQDPGLLVKQVATKLGFTDYFHFSRMFKKVFGLPPEAFRHLR
jgi:AraC-like DNA-binding protein